jgi:hypothetical protein
MPFASHFTGNGTYQQVYDAQLFPGKVKITSVGFAVADLGLPGFGDGDYKVSFSVTPKPICGLDGTDLNSNVGSRPKYFFGGSLNGGVEISGTPFIYDPAEGNLLMIIEVSGRGPVDWNSQNHQGSMFRGPSCQGSSRAWNWMYGSQDADNVGLVTIFRFVSMSEHGQPNATGSATVPTPAITAPMPGDVTNSGVIKPN